MRSVQELLTFCKIDTHKHKSEYEQGINAIVEGLGTSEEVLYISATKCVMFKNNSVLNCALIAITNKQRLIVGGQQKKMFKTIYSTNSYDADKVSSASVVKVAVGATIKIETVAHDDFTCFFNDIETATKVSNELTNAIEESKSAKNGANNAATAMDELKKLKELLDMGIVSQEEFDAKKKQLLGL